MTFNFESPAPLSLNSLSNHIRVKINNKTFIFLIDSGASRSVLNLNYVKDVLKQTNSAQDNILFMVFADGNIIHVHGSVTIDLNVSGLMVPLKFLVLENLTSNFILGSDFLSHTKAVLNFAINELFLFEGLVTVPFQSDISNQCMVFCRIPTHCEANIPVKCHTKLLVYGLACILTYVWHQ